MNQFTAFFVQLFTTAGWSKRRHYNGSKKAEEELRFLASIAGNIQDPIISSNNDFVITRWNNAAEKLLGWTSEEAIGQLSAQVLNVFYPGEARTEILIAYQKKGCWQGELIYHTKSGEPVHVLATSSQLKDHNGTVTGNLTVAKDISKRKKAEEALNKLNEELEQRVKERTEELSKSEMRFRSLIENSAEGISLLDADSNVLYRSPSASKILGDNPKEKVISLAHPDELENFQNKFAEALSKPGVPIAYQVNYLHAAGHHFWAEGTFTNLLHLDAVHAVVANFRDITQRKDLEVLLHKANELARIGGWEIDVIKGTVYWSAITREIHETTTDYVPDIATGINFYKEGPGRDLITEKVQEAMVSGTPWDVELEIITAKNNERWIRSIGQTEFADERCIRVYGSFQDITQRKRAEEKLIEHEKQFRHTLDNMLEGAQIIGFDWRYKYINNSLARHAKYKREEMIGYTVMEKFPGIENTEIFKVYQRCFQKRIAIHLENEFEFPDKTTGCFELSFQPIPEGIFILSIDITERNRITKQLVESEKLYRNLFTNMLHGFAYCKAIFEDGLLTDYTYLAVNSEYELLTGLQNIAGKNVSEVMPGLLASDPYYIDIMTEVLTTGKPAKFETYVAPLKQWFSTSLYSPEKDHFVSLVDNITERKLADQKIQELNTELEEKVSVRTEQLRKTNEELEAFSYSVSHDLRAPLRSIIGFANVLEEDYGKKLDTEARRITGIIKKNTSKMGNLIDDLLAFSRLGRQELLKTTINMNTLVEEVINETDVKEVMAPLITWDLHELPACYGDKNTMRQVWVNLISNAIKYSGTSVNPGIEIGAKANTEKNIFYIKDNGVGFNKKYEDKLFKVFQRLHSGKEFDGTGIGLAIVEKIITKHGGEVWADSKPGEGATFYFSLPLHSSKMEYKSNT